MKSIAALSFVALAALNKGCPGQPQPVHDPLHAPDDPAPSGAPSASAPQPAAVEASSVPLFVAADGFTQRVTLHPLAGATLVTSYRFVGELAGDEITSKPELIAGADKAFEHGTLTLGGRWPDAAWLGTSEDESLSRWSVKAYKRKGSKWTDARPREEAGAFYSAVTLWSDGRVLALRNDLSHGKFVMDLLDGAKTALPEPEQLPSGQSHLLVQTGVAMTTGEVFALGWEWGAPEHQLAVERWAKGAKKGTFDRLPMPEDLEKAWPWAIYARAANEVWVAATVVKKGGVTAPYLARFDGSAWTQESVPVERDLYGVSGASDGTLCVMGKGKEDDAHEAQAWCRAAGGAWKRLAYPDGRMIPRQVWPRSASDVWVSAVLPPSAQGPSPNVLFRTVKPASAFHAPSFAQLEWELEPYKPPIPGSAGCSKLFALLFTLTKATPADYDFPSTRAALKGHPEYASVKLVESMERGKRYFGAIVPTFEVGKKLVALVKANVSGSTPQLLCREPPVRREMKIDFATGDVVK